MLVALLALAPNASPEAAMTSIRRTSSRSIVSNGPSSMSSYGGGSMKAYRAQSVYGVPWATGGRASVASGGYVDLSVGLGGDVLGGASFNEKACMQNLNDRLAAYLEKVRALEAANAQLELQIREWYSSHHVAAADYSKYYPIIDDLRKKIHNAVVDNAKIVLHIDNAKLAAEDFTLKFDHEAAMRMSIEADVAGLRRVLDELALGRSDLELCLEGLREELVYLKKNHEEELAALRASVSSSSVNVEVDAAPQQSLSAVIDGIRSQYEAIAEKNRREMDAWYQAKFDELNTQVAASTESLQTSHSQISELKRTLQALQIELQSQHSLRGSLEGTLAETEARYGQTLSMLQARVDGLEYELSQMKADIERQASEYKILLDIKVRLEMEIAEYRRLLDGEVSAPVKPAVTVVEVKEPPKVVKRVKQVVEEMVDGKVVSLVEQYID